MWPRSTQSIHEWSTRPPSIWGAVLATPRERRFSCNVGIVVVPMTCYNLLRGVRSPARNEVASRK